MAVLTDRIAKPPLRSTRTAKPLLSYSPQLPSPHADIDISLLRNKLLLTCRQYVPYNLLHPALADGIYTRAQHWITPSSQTASRHGKKKRYYILHTHTFRLQQVSSAWEARICSASQPIDAGNGVVLFVKERREWDAFMRGYKRAGKRVGMLLRGRERETEREWRDGWMRRWGVEGGGGGRKEGNAGPMWVVVKSAVGRIVGGEA
ncbi:hypothetical protein GQ44DRAFT_711911 [Phaeosphaeriaceae sp. PMI808]|nr:hypothetical protein GQ44DRAFT_711911 [Phaeosphaeriaceae sp. PMI808]